MSLAAEAFVSQMAGKASSLLGLGTLLCNWNKLTLATFHCHLPLINGL